MSNNLNDLKIFHIDMDAFYASVEEVDNPSIRNYPVIVGGKSDSGIVTTANYKARKYGIHSAMPIFLANWVSEYNLLESRLFVRINSLIAS